MVDGVAENEWYLVSIEEGRVILAEHGNAVLLGDDRERAGVELRVDGEPAAVGGLTPGAAGDLLLNVNQLRNSDLSDGLACWRVAVRAGNPTAGVDLTEDWAVPGIPTGYLQQSKDTVSTVEVIYGDPIDGESMPARGNSRYQTSGYFAAHRCRGELVLQFLDHAERILDEAAEDVGSATGGRDLSGYQRVILTETAPAGTAFVRLLFRKLPMISDGDSYLFFTRLWFGRVEDDAPQPWALPLLSAGVVSGLRRWDLAARLHRIPLPERCFDGKAHTVEVIDRVTIRQAVGSPQQFRDPAVVEGAIGDLDGTTVTGWAQSRSPGQPVEVTLFVDDVVAAKGRADMPEGERSCGFRLPIPSEWLDGLPHRLTVRATAGGKLVGESAHVLPAVLTPWPFLQEYTGPALSVGLAPAARHRYDNLNQWLKSSANLEDAQLTERFSRLRQAHEILVRGPAALRDFAPLALPHVPNPRVSVVVPAHNKFALTYTCLAALGFAFNEAAFEAIVVDDGSSDETTMLPELVEGVTYIRNEVAQGFVRACNLGVSKAHGDYVVLLNNDTEPTGGWLDELLFVFDTFDDVGLAGSKLLYPNGRLQEAGGIVWNSGDPWNYGRDGNAQEPRFNYTRQVDYLSGAAVMLPREVWDAVGGLSEEFSPAYFEDTDLAFKVRALGKRVVYAPLSVVYHAEGMSGGVDPNSGAKRFQEINRPKFKRKWVDAYRFNGDPDKEVDLNKDRGIRFRVLMIDHRVPQADYDAGSYAAVQEIRLLQSLGCKVTFLPVNLAYLGTHTQMLQRLGVETLHAPYVTSIGDLLSSRGSEFDIVYLRSYSAARTILADVRRLAPRAKVLFCNVDLHFLRELRAAISRKDPAAVEETLMIRDQELEVMRQVDVVLSFTSTEHAVILSHTLGRTPVMFCPWVVDVKDDVPPFEARRDIAFLGGFAHPPNKPAVLFFVSEVMPLLRQRLPGVRFRVYGSLVPADIKSLGGDDVVIEGFVEDIAQVFDTCRVFVAPLLTGAGLKGKVIDCLACGTPSVLSPVAMEGTGLRHGFEALVAETPEQWATAVAQLYQDRELWEEISTRTRSYARATYSFAKGRDLMRKALEAIDLYPPTQASPLVSLTARAKI